MAKLSKAFNAKEFEDKAFEPLPEGPYLAEITDSEVKENSKQTGHIAKLTFTVLGEEHKGKKVFHNLNVDNPNETAVEIAQRQMKQMCVAIGEPNLVLEDTSQLHGKPMLIYVTVREGNAQFGPSNNINRFAPPEGDGGGDSKKKGTPWD